MPGSPTMPTLLVVEDDVDVLAPLAQALRALIPGAQVVPAINTADAMMVLRSKPIHLVVADMNMPGASGVDLVTWLRQNLPDLPWILMTAFPVAGRALTGLGKDRLFHKPFDPRLLAAAALRLLRPAPAEIQGQAFA